MLLSTFKYAIGTILAFGQCSDGYYWANSAFSPVLVHRKLSIPIGKRPLTDPPYRQSKITLAPYDAKQGLGAQTCAADCIAKNVRFTGGDATFSDRLGAWYLPVASVLPAQNGNLGAMFPRSPDLMAWGWEAHFRVADADKVVVTLASGASSNAIRLRVDGRYVASGEQDGSATVRLPSNARTAITLPVPGGATHEITLSAERDVGLMGLAVPFSGSISRSPAPPHAIVAFATGDSYSEGIGATDPGLDAWPKQLGRIMGWDDVRQVAVGATGILSKGVGRSILREQISRWSAVNADVPPGRVDVVLFAPGVNDSHLLRQKRTTQEALAAEYLDDLRLVRATFPKAYVIVFGVAGGASGPDSAILAMEDAAHSTFKRWQDGHSVFIPVSRDSKPWLFGTGHVGAPDGTGNADFAVSADGLHPSDAGHRILACRAAAALRGLLPADLAPTAAAAAAPTVPRC